MPGWLPLGQRGCRPIGWPLTGRGLGAQHEPPPSTALLGGLSSDTGPGHPARRAPAEAPRPADAGCRWGHTSSPLHASSSRSPLSGSKMWTTRQGSLRGPPQAPHPSAPRAESGTRCDSLGPQHSWRVSPGPRGAEVGGWDLGTCWAPQLGVGTGMHPAIPVVTTGKVGTGTTAAAPPEALVRRAGLAHWGSPHWTGTTSPRPSHRHGLPDWPRRPCHNSPPISEGNAEGPPPLAGRRGQLLGVRGRQSCLGSHTQQQQPATRAARSGLPR